MYEKKIKAPIPFSLLSNIKDLENELVSVRMIGKMHDSKSLADQVKIIVSLLDISRKLNFLGYTSRSYRTYIRAAKLAKLIGVNV